MNAGRHVTAVVAMAIGALSTGRAVGCPHCNIHNLLADSVRSSTNIFHGQVLRQVDDWTAEVKVLKVLRGTHKVGSNVTNRMYKARAHVGETFIFSDPTGAGHNFEVLTLDYEDEVLFLAQKEPSVGNLEEAIKRVQGVSVETQKIGMKYIADHHDAAVKPLIAELNSLAPQVFSGKEVFFGQHRLGKLVEALLLKRTNEGRDFLFSQIDDFARERERPRYIRFDRLCLVVIPGAIGLCILLAGLSWFRSGVLARWPFLKSRRSLLILAAVASLVLACAVWYLGPWVRPAPRYLSSRGVFLRDMLCQTQRHQELSTAARERMFDVCLRLKGPTLAAAVYAMVLARVATPDELQAKLNDEESADMLALGLYFAGNEESRWLQDEKAYALWDRALSVAKGKELKEAIFKEIAGSERFRKRKNKNARKPINGDE